MLSISIQKLFKGLYRRCVCGCGYLILIIGGNHQIRSYKFGHFPRGEKSHRYKNGKSKSMGYETTYFRDNPYGYYRQIHTHRLVMSQFLGRKLERWEHVHHIDGNKENNDISNLQLLTDSEHAVITVKSRKKKHNGEKCSNPDCKTPYETYINPEGHQIWCRDGNGGYLCKKCYQNKQYKLKKIPKVITYKDYSNTRCSIPDCPHPDKTTLNNIGRPMWYGNDIDGRVCSACYRRIKN